MTDERVRLMTLNAHLDDYHPGVDIIRIEYVYESEEPVIEYCPVCGDPVQPAVRQPFYE